MGAIAAIAAGIVVFALINLLRGDGGGASSNVLGQPEGETPTPSGDRPTLPRPAGGGDPVLSGRVLDSSGAPLAGVTITVTAELAAPDPGDPGGGIVVGGGVATTTSDDNGGFALAGLPPGLHRIGIEGDDVVTAEVRFVELPALELDITALRQVALSGSLVGERPGEVSVIARGELGEERTIADADGTFALAGLPEGVYQLWAEGGDVGSAAITVEARGARQFSDLTLTLQATITVRGQLFDRETGSAVAGDVVFTSESGEPDRRTATDASGSYTVGALLPGRWSAQALAAGYVPTEQLAFEADRPRKLDLTISRGGAIEGRTVDPDGNPVAGAIVLANHDSDEIAASVKQPTLIAAAAPGTQFIPRGELGILVGPIPFPPPRPLTRGRVAQPVTDQPTGFAPTDNPQSDDDGRFRISGLRAGRYRLIASHPDFAGGVAPDVTVALGATRADVRIILRRGVRISGEVTGSDGTAIVGAIVTAVIAGNPPMSAVASIEGRYELPPLTGTITLEASAPGYARARRVTPVAKDGAEQRIDFTLERADKQLVGRVVDSTGFPVRSARVTIDGSAAGDTTDDAGRFEITGVPTGSHSIKVSHASFPPLVTSINTDDTGDTREITLPIGGGLSGELRDARNSRPVARATIEVRLGTIAVTAKSDDDGQFTVTPLAAGTWKLTVAALGYARLEQAIEIEAGRAPGEITARDKRFELHRGVTLAGVVMDENGERVTSAVVKVGGLETTTDIDGRFRLTEVPAGELVIDVSFGDRSGSEELELSPGDERTSLDIRIHP